MTIIILVILSCFLLLVSIVIYEVHKQNKFNKKCYDEWQSMTKEEQLASGRDDMYC